MLRKIKNIICFMGLWIPIVAIIVYVTFMRQFRPQETITLSGAMNVVKWSLIPMFLNILINSTTYSNGKRDYLPLDALLYKTDKYYYPQAKIAHEDKYPEIDRAMAVKTPLGEKIILGKLKDKYMAVDMNSGGSHNVIVVGETGCGKTSTIVLSTVIANMSNQTFSRLRNVKKSVEGSKVTSFVIDVKGEISHKGTAIDAPDIKLIEPGDHASYGYDPFYTLKTTSNEQDIIDCMKTICFSLLPINPQNGGKEFWDKNGRDMLLAFMLHFYKQGKHNLIDIIDAIMSVDVGALIEEIASSTASNSVERKLISRFIGTASETLGSVGLSMQTDLNVFITDENIRYMLRDNTQKATPQDLNRGTSTYYVIPEEKLDNYSVILHLIINQTILEMEKRITDDIPVLMIIDELARILSAGTIEKLMNGLETLRSRGVAIMLITQSLDALERAYSYAEVQSIVANCPYKVILSASARNTQDLVVRWSGKAKVGKYSHGKSGTRYSSNTAQEEKNIVEPSELIKLPTEGDAIIISPYGYNRVKKVSYYNDKFLKPLAKAIKEHNEMLNDIKKEQEESGNGSSTEYND